MKKLILISVAIISLSGCLGILYEEDDLSDIGISNPNHVNNPRCDTTAIYEDFIVIEKLTGDDFFSQTIRIDTIENHQDYNIDFCKEDYTKKREYNL